MRNGDQREKVEEPLKWEIEMMHKLDLLGRKDEIKKHIISLLPPPRRLVSNFFFWKVQRPAFDLVL